MARRTSPSKVRTVRKEYEQAKRLYKKLGRMTFRSRKNSEVRRDYKAAKREYNKIGKQLGQMTGKKPRR